MKSDCPQGGVCAVATPLVGWLALALACAVLAGILSCRKSSRSGGTSAAQEDGQNRPLKPRTITLPPKRRGVWYLLSLRDENSTTVKPVRWSRYISRSSGPVVIDSTGTEMIVMPFKYHTSSFQSFLYDFHLRKRPPEPTKYPAGLSFLAALGPNDIQGLDLSECRLRRKDLAILTKLTALRHLFLGSTNVKDGWLAEVARLKDLRTLDLSQTKITAVGLAHLKGLTALRVLILSKTPLTDSGLAHLKTLSSLRRLDLSETQITDAGLVHLQGMTSLRSLRLDTTEISDEGLIHLKPLTSLEMLDLSFCDNITDAGLAHLAEMTRLRWLVFRATRVTDKGVAELRKALPKCEIPK
jgi:hypothetical protein